MAKQSTAAKPILPEMASNQEINRAPEMVAPSSYQMEDTGGFQPHPGEYHLVRIDHFGNEVPGTDVSVHPHTYERAFKDRTDFTVKKKPN